MRADLCVYVLMTFIVLPYESYQLRGGHKELISVFPKEQLNL
jgi:hypothetical protein